MHQSKLVAAGVSLVGVAMGAAPGGAAASQGQSGVRSDGRSPAAATTARVAEQANLSTASFNPRSEQRNLVRAKDGSLVPVLAVHTVAAKETLSAIARITTTTPAAGKI